MQLRNWLNTWEGGKLNRASGGVHEQRPVIRSLMQERYLVMLDKAEKKVGVYHIGPVRAKRGRPLRARRRTSSRVKHDFRRETPAGRQTANIALICFKSQS